MLRQILLYDFGELTQLIDRIEQFRHFVRKHEEQSGESVTDNVRQAVFQAGIKDAAIRDDLALHAGRLNSFDKMAAEVSNQNSFFWREEPKLHFLEENQNSFLGEPKLFFFLRRTKTFFFGRNQNSFFWEEGEPKLFFW